MENINLALSASCPAFARRVSKTRGYKYVCLIQISRFGEYVGGGGLLKQASLFQVDLHTTYLHSITLWSLVSVFTIGGA